LKKPLLILLTIPVISSIAFASDIDVGNIEVGFSPKNGSLELILKAINSSNNNLCMATYSFTSKPVAEAVLKAKTRGVKVRVVSDSKSNQSKYSMARFLANNGVDVRINDNYTIMHNKFIVIDNQTVETGSFNYSKAAANKNAENVIVIWDDKQTAHKYLTECDRLYAESSPLKAYIITN
jgi:phosphatidylserine/phosphatidylglycerophosphate/cardiolipin synthase-like enzyme